MSLIECVYAKDEIEKKTGEKKEKETHTGKISRVL